MIIVEFLILYFQMVFQLFKGSNSNNCKIQKMGLFAKSFT